MSTSKDKLAAAYTSAEEMADMVIAIYEDNELDEASTLIARALAGWIANDPKRFALEELAIKYGRLGCAIAPGADPADIDAQLAAIKAQTKQLEELEARFKEDQETIRLSADGKEYDRMKARADAAEAKVTELAEELERLRGIVRMAYLHALDEQRGHISRRVGDTMFEFIKHLTPDEERQLGRDLAKYGAKGGVS